MKHQKHLFACFIYCCLQFVACGEKSPVGFISEPVAAEPSKPSVTFYTGSWQGSSIQTSEHNATFPLTIVVERSQDRQFIRQIDLTVRAESFSWGVNVSSKISSTQAFGLADINKDGQFILSTSLGSATSLVINGAFANGSLTGTFNVKHTHPQTGEVGTGSGTFSLKNITSG